MKIMQSFLIFFYILDQGYSECQEDDLGGFLGAISPELWADGQPMDKSIFNDWIKISNPETVDAGNIIKRTYDFLVHYESAFGFNFSQARQWLLLSANKEIIEKAYDKAKIMYQKFCYDN